MLSSSLKIAWRNLTKDRQFALLNLAGLSVGLVCTLLIYLWVFDELHVDKFHDNDARLYQIMQNVKDVSGIRTIPETPALLADALAKEMPEVEHAAAAQGSFSGKYTLSVGDKAFKATGLYATGDYFNVFSWGLIQGNKDQVLSRNDGIVLSSQLATRLFGSPAAAMGKQVAFQRDKLYFVAGVTPGPPVNSSVQFDFLLPFQTFLDDNPDEKLWTNSDPSTFIVLKKGADPLAFQQKLIQLVKSRTHGGSPNFLLQHFSDRYLHGKYSNGQVAGGRIDYVRIFSLIGFFILVIACINFMNLATAKASRRMKEVGVRKCIGASRVSLIRQYLTESILMAFVSLFVALLLVLLILPAFNTFTGKALDLSGIRRVAFPFAGITLFAGLLAGSYPALYLSGFKPVAVLKGQLRNSAGAFWVRKGLVVFQFTLSVLFIIASIVVYRQLSLIQHIDKGFDKDNVVFFSAEGMTAANANTFLIGVESFISELKEIPGVVGASSMDHNSIVADYGNTSDIAWTGKDPKSPISFGNVGINYGLIETLGMKMAAGRSFSTAASSDSSEIIFNEAAIAAMGLKDPVGKTVRMWGQDRRIAGVVKDFHFESLHETVKPFALRLEPQNTYRFVVKIRSGMEGATLQKINDIYKTRYPGFAFDYQFLDQDYQAQYNEDKRIAGLSLSFTILTIFISCIGLFGLAAFTAEKRFKEIGIRKVLGASVTEMVLLLSGDFVRLVMAGILIAIPLAWWATTQWLNGFAYRIRLDPGMFLLATLAILTITLLTVSFQSVRAALTPPVRSLKSE